MFEVNRKRKIEGHTLYSAHLQEERNLKVFIPPDYDESKRYPVLYCHDGLEFFTHGRIATIAHQLILEAQLCPVLIVGIGVHPTYRTDDYALSGRRNASFSRFVMEECLPFIQTHYAADENQRHMAGISLGAVAALQLALSHPATFRNLLLFSGAYYEDVRNLVKTHGDLSYLETYVTVGRQETAVETPHGTYNFYRFNHEMRDMLRIRGARVEFEEADGAHLWGFWQHMLPSALKWLNRQIAR